MAVIEDKAVLDGLQRQVWPHNYHPNLHLLAVERTGWRRWIFGRWVFNSEPFRRDIQRQCAKANVQMLLKPWERICDPSDAT